MQNKTDGLRVVDSSKLNETQTKQLEKVVHASTTDKFLGSDESEVVRDGERRLVLLYGVQQEVIGFMSPKRQSYRGTNHWRAGAIFTVPKYRGRGLMFAALLEFFTKHQPGLSWIDDANHPSIELFKKLGFVKDKQRSHDGYDGHWYSRQKVAENLPASSKW